MRTKFLLIPILILALVVTGCPSKTTLDRIGTATVVGVNLYLGQIEGLYLQNRLTEAKYLSLTDQGKAIKARAEKFRDTIAGFAKIKPGDVKGIVEIAADLVDQLDATLRDPAIKALPTDHDLVKKLSYIRLGVSQARIAVEALFPTPTETVTTASAGARSMEPRGIALSKIVVTLPKQD